MTSLSRAGVLLAVTLLMALVAAIPPATAGDTAPTATSSDARCSVRGRERDFPPATYVTSQKVRGTTCRNGRTVMRAFHRCRGSRRGRCNRRVYGYRCSENRDRTHQGFESIVSCRKGGRGVWHRYTQWL